MSDELNYGFEDDASLWKDESTNTINYEVGMDYEEKDGVLVWVDESFSSFTVPEGIKEIGNEAFSTCSVECVFISSNVEVINEFAFFCCDDLKSVFFSNGLKVIDNFAFYETGISSVTLPDTITYIGYKAFSECALLNEVIIPEGVKYIGDSAFENTAITNITIPGTVMTIAARTFLGCCELKEVYLNPGVINLQERLFNALEKLVLPGTIDNIDDQTFSECKAINTLIFTSYNHKIASHALNKLYNTTLQFIEIPCDIRYYDDYVLNYLTLHNDTEITINYNSFQELYEFILNLVHSDIKVLNVNRYFWLQGPRLSSNEVFKINHLIGSQLYIFFSTNHNISFVPTASIVYSCSNGQIDVKTLSLIRNNKQLFITFIYKNSEELLAFINSLSYGTLNTLKGHKVIFKGPKYYSFFRDAMWKLMGIDYKFEVDYSLKKVKQ